MKKIACLSVLTVLALAALSSAQTVPGKRFELSTSASFYSYKETDAATVISIPVRLGISVFKGLAIEPEATFSLTSFDGESSTGILGLLNLTYSFGSAGKAVPFLLAGIGYGNGREMLDLVSDLKLGILALDAGAGVRFMISDAAAIRVEYRFVRYSGKKTITYSSYYYSGSYDYDYGLSMHKILLGISIFL